MAEDRTTLTDSQRRELEDRIDEMERQLRDLKRDLLERLGRPVD